MRTKNVLYSLLIMLILALTLVVGGCGEDAETPQNDPLVLEPGLTNQEPDPDNPDPDEGSTPTDDPPEDPNQPENPPESEEPTDNFVDLERSSTLDDLMANKAQIESYYFEQTVNYSSGPVTMKTWYKDQKMKIITSADYMLESVFYYDWRGKTIVSYTPEFGDAAGLYTFENDDPSLPDKPLEVDYHECKVLETAEINGQICRVLQSPDGHKLWISTKYGFPVQVEFTDTTTGEDFIVTYQSLTFNQVADEDVEVPAHLVIFDAGADGGY